MHNHPLFIDSEGGNRKPLEQPQCRKLLQIAQRAVRVRPSPVPTRPCRRPPPSPPAEQHIEPRKTEQWRQRRSSARSSNYRCPRSSVTSTFTRRTLSNNFGAKQHTFSPCVLPIHSARLSADLCVSFIGPLSPRHKSITRAAFRRQSEVITEVVALVLFSTLIRTQRRPPRTPGRFRSPVRAAGSADVGVEFPRRDAFHGSGTESERLIPTGRRAAHSGTCRRPPTNEVSAHVMPDKFNHAHSARNPPIPPARRATTAARSRGRGRPAESDPAGRTCRRSTLIRRRSGR